MRRLFPTWLVCALLFLVGADREPAVGWRYSVKLTDLRRATVLLDLGGLTVRRICVDMNGAGRFVRNVEQVFHGGKTQALLREDECWLLSAASQSVRQVRYDYDLAGAAACAQRKIQAFKNARIGRHAGRHDQGDLFVGCNVLR